MNLVVVVLLCLWVDSDDVIMQSCPLCNISCINLSLYKVRSILVKVHGLQLRPAVASRSCNAATFWRLSVGEYIYTAEYQIVQQLLFINLFMYSALCSQDNIVHVYDRIHKMEIDRRLLWWNTFVLLNIVPFCPIFF